MGVSPKRVVPDLRMNGIRLGIDYAVPCGLIVNELASNSLKYAYPGDADGNIVVTMKQRQEGRETVVSMVFEDDGVGLPDGFDFLTSETLGMKLVKLLSQRQLGGSVSCPNGNGTCFRIEFGIKGQGG
jgi:two-component sensor histidine kinase